MEQYQEVQLYRLEQAEEKAYARRDAEEKLIFQLLEQVKEQKANELFFILRQSFAAWEDAEERCCKATDRLIEYRSNL
jgi:hypothetical protein